jgi:hypothetical protein
MSAIGNLRQQSSMSAAFATMTVWYRIDELNRRSITKRTLTIKRLTIGKIDVNKTRSLEVLPNSYAASNT